MGDRGYNAGGFAYMKVVQCPRCGFKRKLGQRKAKNHPECGDRVKCDARLKKLLDRPSIQVVCYGAYIPTLAKLADEGFFD